MRWDGGGRSGQMITTLLLLRLTSETPKPPLLLGRIQGGEPGPGRRDVHHHMLWGSLSLGLGGSVLSSDCPPPPTLRALCQGS
uniref:Uncharacterized protein n=1 Tax=Knipowitschia caucasica TaxID=637954 RepID=A0AAV2MI36_KNICA